MHFHDRIAEIDAAFSGIVGLAARNLDTGQVLRYRADETFLPASTVKLPVLYEVLRQAREGRFRLEQPLQLQRHNMVEGGVLADLTPGLALSVRDMAVLMITVSDNSATNELVELVTPEAVTRSMAELGLTGITLNRRIGIGAETPLGIAVPGDYCRLLELIHEEQVLTPADCRIMIDILKRQKYKELTVRYFEEWDDEPEEPVIEVGCKSGWVRGMRHEVAIVWAPRATYVFAVFTKECRDRRYHIDNEANLAVARISRALFDEWGRTRQSAP
jgi:beta-lactamase class A